MKKLLSRRPAAFLMGVALVAGASSATLAAAALTPATLSAWAKYATATEQRINRELTPRTSFLAVDYAADAAATRRALLAGELAIDEVSTVGPSGSPIEVPSAMVHHWRGAVLIPGARLDALLARLRSGPPRAGEQEDILDSRVLERRPDGLKVFLKVQRTKFVTVVYRTEHEIRFKQHGARRASSSSTATHIAELTDPGTPQERELAPGDDRGFLWRWNTYWRYEEVPGGVIAECESISLSRDVPSVVRYLAAPMIRSTARESMERTLAALRQRHRQ